MNRKSLLHLVISVGIASKLFAQNYSAKDISEKSINAIENFKKGFFSIDVQWKPEKFSGNITFYRDSVKFGEIPQFILVQNNDTVLVYDGKNYFLINNKTKRIKIYKGLVGELSLGISGKLVKLEAYVDDIFEFADIYFRKSSAPLCWDMYPYKVEGIKKTNSYYCYIVKDTLDEHRTQRKNVNAYGFTYIDTSSYLPIKKVQICNDLERTIRFSNVHALKESDNFTFDVNLFAIQRGYTIEKAETVRYSR